MGSNCTYPSAGTNLFFGKRPIPWNFAEGPHPKQPFRSTWDTWSASSLLFDGQKALRSPRFGSSSISEQEVMKLRRSSSPQT